MAMPTVNCTICCRDAQVAQLRKQLACSGVAPAPQPEAEQAEVLEASIAHWIRHRIRRSWRRRAARRCLPLSLLARHWPFILCGALRRRRLAPWPRHAMLLHVGAVSVSRCLVANQRLLQLAQLAIAMLLGAQQLTELLFEG